MNKVDPDMKLQMIETTIGDLICAIQDAAQEASINDTERTKITHLILMDILKRNSKRSEAVG